MALKDLQAGRTVTLNGERYKLRQKWGGTLTDGDELYTLVLSNRDVYRPGPIDIFYRTASAGSEWFNAGIGDVAPDDPARCESEGCREFAEFALDEWRGCWRHALTAYQDTLLDMHADTVAIKIESRRK